MGVLGQRRLSRVICSPLPCLPPSFLVFVVAAILALDKLPVTEGFPLPKVFPSALSAHRRCVKSTTRSNIGWRKNSRNISNSRHNKSGSTLSVTLLSPLLLGRDSGGMLHRLPSVSADPGAVLRTSVVGGGACLISQLVLYLMFRRSRDPIRRKNAGYTAHSVVALVLMATVSAIGVVGYHGHTSSLPSSLLPAAATTAAGRILVPSGQARWLASTIVGALALWDIPTSLRVVGLRKPDVIAHHLAMLVVAWWGATLLPTGYLFYYFGVSEVSSVPLVLYDQLSLDAEELATRGEDEEEKAGTSSLVEKETGRKRTGGQTGKGVGRLQRMERRRDGFQILAALSFTVVRAFGFTKVTLVNFVPDCLCAIRTLKTVGGRGGEGMTAGVSLLLLRSILLSSLAFTLLQLYWFAAIVKVVVLGDSGDKENGKKEGKLQ